MEGIYNIVYFDEPPIIIIFFCRNEAIELFIALIPQLNEVTRVACEIEVHN